MKTWRALAFATVAAAGFGGGIAYAHPQPTMENALRALREARHFLDVAAQDKGGWRARAIQDVQSAIQDVQNGISYANQSEGG